MSDGRIIYNFNNRGKRRDARTPPSPRPYRLGSFYPYVTTICLSNGANEWEKNFQRNSAVGLRGVLATTFARLHAANHQTEIGIYRFSVNALECKLLLHSKNLRLISKLLSKLCFIVILYPNTRVPFFEKEYRRN